MVSWRKSKHADVKHVRLLNAQKAKSVQLYKNTNEAINNTRNIYIYIYLYMCLCLVYYISTNIPALHIYATYKNVTLYVPASSTSCFSDIHILWSIILKLPFILWQLFLQCNPRVRTTVRTCIPFVCTIIAAFTFLSCKNEYQNSTSI